jgi:hypothetical protein
MKFALKTRYKLLLAIVGAGVLSILIWLSQQKKSVEYTGTVIDSETGLAVPNAKVVLSTWYYGFFDSNPTHIGTFTDEAGYFTIRASPGYWIDDVDLSACSKTLVSPRLRNLRESKPVRITLSKPDSSKLGDFGSGFDYYDFSGGWGGDVHWIKN